MNSRTINLYDANVAFNKPFFAHRACRLAGRVFWIMSLMQVLVAAFFSSQAQAEVRKRNVSFAQCVSPPDNTQDTTRTGESLRDTAAARNPLSSAVPEIRTFEMEKKPPSQRQKPPWIVTFRGTMDENLGIQLQVEVQMTF